jgi:HEPN domain-containing protein
MKPELVVNDFATRSFRDIADQDYISARAAFRHQFDFHFRWCGLQAVEKYLKAILLYNQESSKSISHNLLLALRRVRGIQDLEFELPPRVEGFIEYLDRYGRDRYFSYTTYLPEGALTALDETVWYIRRFCFYMRGRLPTGELLLPKYVAKAKSHLLERQPHRYRLVGGYLERVLDQRLPGYRDLVWKNFYYGRIAKPMRLRVREWTISRVPTHVLHPDAFAILDKLVDFPKRVREAFKRQTRATR